MYRFIVFGGDGSCKVCFSSLLIWVLVLSKSWVIFWFKVLVLSWMFEICVLFYKSYKVRYFWVK